MQIWNEYAIKIQVSDEDANLKWRCKFEKKFEMS